MTGLKDIKNKIIGFYYILTINILKNPLYYYVGINKLYIPVW